MFVSLNETVLRKHCNTVKETEPITADASYWVLIILKRELTFFEREREGYFPEKNPVNYASKVLIIVTERWGDG